MLLTRRRLTLAVAATVLVAAATAIAVNHGPLPKKAAAPTLHTAPQYLKEAEAAVASARAWWDPKTHWWRQTLQGTGAATNWGSVHLFGAIDALAIASPTPAHLAAVRFFARGAEKYWNPDLRPVPGYGAAPGNRGANTGPGTTTRAGGGSPSTTRSAPPATASTSPRRTGRSSSSTRAGIP